MALIARVKNWATNEQLLSADLNAEFDNILDNLTASNIEDFSTNVAQMQSMTDPGEVGSESLATSLAGELQRIRFIISEITGEDEWYESPVASLVGISNALGTGIDPNRLVSGRVGADSDIPKFLVPNGAARTVKVDGNPTNFIYYVNGTTYTISADTTLTNLTAAPSSNNTCLIDDAGAADQDWTKHAGENGTEIRVDTMGSEITALTGKYGAFKLDNGSTSEYFLAYVNSTTSLTKARRGYFFDSADAPSVRITYANNDTITLMKLSWIFAKTDLSLEVGYTNPSWGKDEPSSPATGDFWYDTVNLKWKKYNGTSFAEAGSTLIGVCIQDTTATVGARSFEFFLGYDELNSLELVANSNSTVKTKEGGQINAWGNTVKLPHGFLSWDMTLDLDSGVTEQASTTYYFYVTEDGDKVISNVRPYDRRGDLQGYYHPHQSWRCVGWAFNNGSQNLEQVQSFYNSRPKKLVRELASADYILARDEVVYLTGASATYNMPSAALFPGKEIEVFHAGTSVSQVYTLQAYGSETFTVHGSTASTYLLHTNSEYAKFLSVGGSWVRTDARMKTTMSSTTTLTITGTSANPTKGTTQQADKISWYRDGKYAHVHIEYRQTSGAGGLSGTGDYLILIPGGLTADTTMVEVNTTVNVNLPAQGTLDGVVSITNAATTGAMHGRLYDSTHFTIYGVITANDGSWSSADFDLSGQVHCYGWVKIPISGWND